MILSILPGMRMSIIHFGPAVITRLLESRGYQMGSFPSRTGRTRQCDHIRRAKACIFSICRQYGFHGESLFCLQKAQKIRCLYARRRDGQTSGLCNRGLWKPDPSDLQTDAGYSRQDKLSLRRLAHYDYWSDRLKRSVLLDSGADMISYGMGEHSIVEIAEALDAGIAVSDMAK